MKIYIKDPLVKLINNANISLSNTERDIFIGHDRTKCHKRCPIGACQDIISLI